MKLKYIFLTLFNLLVIILNIPTTPEYASTMNLVLTFFAPYFLVLNIILIVVFALKKNLNLKVKKLYMITFLLSSILSLIALYIYSLAFDKADLTSYSQLSVFDKLAPNIFFSLSLLVFVNSIFFVDKLNLLRN